MPIAAAYHIAAAVVRLVIFLSISLFKIMPAHKNPMHDTTCAAIREVEFGSTKEDRNVKIIAPPITRQWVLIPAGLFLDSLSAPIANPAPSTIPISIKKRIS
jgi:hypothetical protein